MAALELATAIAVGLRRLDGRRGVGAFDYGGELVLAGALGGGADALGGVAHGFLGDVVVEEAELDVALQRHHFALGGAAGSLGAGEAVPGASEGCVVGAAAVSVGGQHRADAAGIAVAVTARDD